MIDIGQEFEQVCGAVNIWWNALWYTSACDFSITSPDDQSTLRTIQTGMATEFGLAHLGMLGFYPFVPCLQIISRLPYHPPLKLARPEAVRSIEGNGVLMTD
jgi:hypothetical protein